MPLYNKFDFKLDSSTHGEKIVLEISRCDYEIIKNSLQNCLYAEMAKTPWEPNNNNEYWYRGNKITKRIESTLKYIKRQVEHN